MNTPISRRTVLRGLGVSVALPWLEIMAPLARAASPGKAPTRMAFMYVPNGKNMAEWTPKAEGTNYALTPILEPLKELRSEFSVLTNLTADKARPHGDGGGDHARALGAFLTGAQPKKTDGTDIRAGISVDQVAASRLADQTRLPSIELGCEHGAMAGNCDSGYSCVYSSTMSWKSATQPLPKDVDPKTVFARLFGTTNDAQRKLQDERRKSVLDFVQEDSKDLAGKLGSTDQRKLDEYFTAVRELEQRIARADKLPPPKTPDMKTPTGIPAKYEDHVRLMYDLLALAFQTDTTRVATMVLANEGSNRPYPMIGVTDGHHDLSHHENKGDKKAKISKINTFHTTQLANFLAKLKGIREGDGTLLDQCMIVYGSGNSDGNAHNHDDLPILLAGRGSGTLTPGRHIKFGKETPLNNLWLAMLARMGIQQDRLGDSTGELKGI